MSDRRTALLVALEAELELHGAWFDAEYTKGEVPDGSNWNEPKYTVVKVDSFMVDEALANSELFSNEALVPALLSYRQRVVAFNQLIDRAMLFQSNAALWEDNPSPALLARMEQLTAGVHTAGIGNATSGAAHKARKDLLAEVAKEKDS